jgi:hypothetical protein
MANTSLSDLNECLEKSFSNSDPAPRADNCGSIEHEMNEADAIMVVAILVL